jgi:hypothetical protein
MLNIYIHTPPGPTSLGAWFLPHEIQGDQKVSVYLMITVHKKRAKIQGAYKLTEYFAKPYFHKYLTEIRDVTTIWKRNVFSFISDYDVQIAVGTRVELPQNCYIAQIPGYTNYARSARQPFPSRHWFTLFSRDGSSDYRTIPNVTFTILRHFLLTLWSKEILR